MSATYQINTEKNGVEITFDAIPGDIARVPVDFEPRS